MDGQLFDQEAEEQVLGDILSRSETARNWRSEVGENPAVFYRVAHKEIYAAMLELDDKGVKIEPVAVVEKLKEKGVLREIGNGTVSGEVYIYELVDGAIGANFLYYVSRIREFALRRRIIEFGRSLTNWAVGDKELDEIWTLITGGIDQLKSWAKPIGSELMSAPDLAKEEFPPVEWVIEDFLPVGVTLLVGKPKAGKSWMALNLALAVAKGGVAFGSIQVDRGNVLYLALEDTPRRMKGRIAQLDGNDADGLFLCFEIPRGSSGIMMLSRLMDSKRFKLIIVDPLAFFRDPAHRNSDIYMLDYEVMGAFRDLSIQYSCAVLILHHTRKAIADDPIDLILGTTGLGGAADTTWILNRSRGAMDASLLVTGRDVPEREYAFRRDPEIGWRMLGDAENYKVSKERAEVVELLKDSEDGMSIRDIADAMGKSIGAVKMLLSRMVRDNILERVARGKYRLANNNQVELILGEV